MRAMIFCVALCLVGLGSAHSQASHLDVSFGAGFTEPVGKSGGDVDTGWNLDVRGGYKATPHLAVDLDFNYNRWNLTGPALARFGESYGYTTIWSVSLLPVVRGPEHWHMTPYVMGGPGLYYRNLTLTQPALINTIYCDPFFGFCYPATIGVNQVVASATNYKLGINGGAGIETRLGHSHFKAFGEARYSSMFGVNGSTLSFVPVTFGVRW